MKKNESIGLGSTVDFGFVTVGTSYSSKFYVQNIGRKPLVLTGTTKIEISGSGADFFELTSVPGDTISAGGKSLLEITFSPNESLSEQSAIVSIDSNSPKSAGNISCTIQIASNCEDNKVYSFIVQGNAIEGNTDSQLKTLSFSEGTLAPAFHSETFLYTLTLDSSVQSLAFTPQCKDEMVTLIEVNGSQISDNEEAQIILGGISQIVFSVTAEDGKLDVSVIVTAEDKKTQKTYKVTCRWLGSLWEKVGTMPVKAANHQVLYHNNRFCLSAYDSEFVDWSFYTSADGKTWIKQGRYDSSETEAAVWHEGGSETVLNNVIYIIGGYRKNGDTDVIAPIVSSSTNGINYTLVTAKSSNSAVSKGFVQCAVAAFNEKLWIFGGNTEGEDNTSVTNNIWQSSDGENFTKVTTSAPIWSERFAHTATVFNEKIYVMGGGGTFIMTEVESCVMYGQVAMVQVGLK